MEALQLLPAAGSPTRVGGAGAGSVYDDEMMEDMYGGVTPRARPAPGPTPPCRGVARRGAALSPADA